jgi:hypothetical protein
VRLHGGMWPNGRVQEAGRGFLVGSAAVRGRANMGVLGPNLTLLQPLVLDRAHSKKSRRKRFPHQNYRPHAARPSPQLSEGHLRDFVFWGLSGGMPEGGPFLGGLGVNG